MKTCGTCNFWVSTQTGRANAKGVCYRYPETFKKWASDFCGDHKVVKGETDGEAMPKRHVLMKQCKNLSIAITPKDTVQILLKKVEDYEQEQEAEAANGQGDEEESGRTELPSG